jgi:hypothetical protein
MPNFVRAANPIWYFPDLLGEPLNDTYYAFFLQNTIPYLPQTVYMDNQGMTQWTSPIQFLPNGTLPQNLYFEDDQVYYLQVRQGNTMSALKIYDIPNFLPSDGGSSTPSTSIGTDNQISNPQFAYLSFTTPLTITTAGTYNIAPGWQLVLTGSGSTTITQIIFNGSESTLDDPIPGNPPYALEFNSNGWTSSILQQTFNNNGALWAQGAVSASLTAQSTTVNQPLSISYVPSVGAGTEIASGTVVTSGYTVLSGAVAIPVSTNTSPSNTASVSFQITLPPNGNVTVTNVQLIGQEDANNPLDVVYEEETVERSLDHLFHYYANELIIKPKNSLLAGWNFAYNPFQFSPVSPTVISTVCQYVADQTILYQENANAFLVGKAAYVNNHALTVNANPSGTASRFALIQYIDPRTIRGYWNYYVSSLVRARIFTSSSSIRFKMRLIYNTALPNALSPTDPIASWPNNSDPVFATGWTAIAPQNDPVFILPNSYGNEGANSVIPFAFDSFLLPTATTDLQTLGVVFYIMDDANPATDSFLFDKISLVPNRFAVDATSECFNKALSDCQYYFEKSYNIDIPPGTGAQPSGAQSIQLFGGINIAGLDRPFKTIKRATPSMVWYSPITGAGSAIYNNSTSSDYSVNNNNTPGLSSTSYPSTTTNPATGSILTAHWVASARLGG